jgi:PhzF family phenazine biosynthesis protein
VTIPLYHLDAFTREPFRGNPAAVCCLERPLDGQTMQAIAAENNLPATAFVTPDRSDFALRWFTPTAELELCGHATLAAGHVLLNVLEPQRERVDFNTRAGRLAVERDGQRLALDFPALRIRSERAPESVAVALGVMPAALWAAEGERGMAVLHDASQVRDLRPNLEAIATLPFSALVVTAPGFAGDCDFVSRYFAPKYGVGEDFVTGSAHCVLTPFWAGVIEKSKLFARQLSARGGELWVEARGDRVRIGGTCVLILEGQFKVQP